MEAWSRPAINAGRWYATNIRRYDRLLYLATAPQQAGRTNVLEWGTAAAYRVKRSDDPLLEVLIGSMTVPRPARRQFTDPALPSIANVVRLLSAPLLSGVSGAAATTSAMLPVVWSRRRGIRAGEVRLGVLAEQALVGDDGGAGADGSRAGLFSIWRAASRLP